MSFVKPDYYITARGLPSILVKETPTIQTATAKFNRHLISKQSEQLQPRKFHYNKEQNIHKQIRPQSATESRSKSSDAMNYNTIISSTTANTSRSCCCDKNLNTNNTSISYRKSLCNQVIKKNLLTNSKSTKDFLNNQINRNRSNSFANKVSDLSQSMPTETSNIAATKLMVPKYSGGDKNKCNQQMKR